MAMWAGTRRVRVAVAMVAFVAACSGDDGGTEEAELSAEDKAEFEEMTAFAQCMREQGVEDFPDPEISGDGFVLQGAPLESRWDEAMDAASEACDEGRSKVEGEAPEEEAAAGELADPAVWEEVTPGGDCQCSDGSEYVFWVRKADPTKVVFYLQDGGACFSVETCTPENDLFQRTISEGPAGEGGMYNLDDDSNPFADHSIVFAPYCSGDVFIGNATTDYAPDLTIQHKGYANGTAALDHLAATFPDATNVVVVGESAGSVAAPLYAGLVADRLPDARITALADGSGSYPDLPEFNTRIAEAWGIESVIPDWADWSVPELFVRTARQHPDITFARHDFAYDENQHIWYPHFGVEVGDLLERIDANETLIEDAGVDLLSYIEAGDGHTALSERELYELEVNGQPLVDWVTKLIAGEPVDDVHCTECSG